MAIDTAAKRRCISALPFLPGVGVTPSAGHGQAWRQSAGWGYLGILAQTIVIAAVTVHHYVMSRHGMQRGRFHHTRMGQ